MRLVPLDIDLSGSWDSLYGDLKAASGFETLINVLSAVGMLVFVVSLLVFAWKKFRSKGGGSGDNRLLLGALLVAGFFCAFDFLIPIALAIADVVANFVADLVDRFASS